MSTGDGVPSQGYPGYGNPTPQTPVSTGDGVPSQGYPGYGNPTPQTPVSTGDGVPSPKTNEKIVEKIIIEERKQPDYNVSTTESKRLEDITTNRKDGKQPNSEQGSKKLWGRPGRNKHKNKKNVINN